jgi:phosphoglycerate dehydrogenase-like enzyme
MAPRDSETRPRVLVTEKISQDGLNLLRETATIDERKGLSPDELAAIIADYEALIVRSETKVTAELLLRAVNLKVVARAGVGVDNVGKWLAVCVSKHQTDGETLDQMLRLPQSKGSL